MASDLERRIHAAAESTKDGGKPEKLPIPEEEMDKANELHNELVEKAAENDEELMELYFEKGNLDEDDMRKGLKIGRMKHRVVFPVRFGCHMRCPSR